eukprot:12909186-Prorocentrum_lima.AAC.1
MLQCSLRYETSTASWRSCQWSTLSDTDLDHAQASTSNGPWTGDRIFGRKPLFRFAQLVRGGLLASN